MTQPFGRKGIGWQEGEEYDEVVDRDKYMDTKGHIVGKYPITRFVSIA
jgi:hypothetical protein